MEMTTSCVYEKNALAWLARESGMRRALNEGGTYSTKTWSVLQLLILIAGGAKRPLLISVVSESLPHLKRGCIRDFRNILGEGWNDGCYNKTEQTYQIGRSLVEFFGADESSKVRGPRRDILYLNEANNIPWDTARGLDVRTRLFTFADWNPVSEFWAHEHWVGSPENSYIHSTYLDALHVLPPEVVTNIESNRDKDPNWWNVYGLGRIGKIEGLVYPYFEQVNGLPDGDCFFGLDFGYSNDPTVLVRNVIIGDCLYSRELIYETGLTNDMIARRMEELGVRRNFDEIFADAAEPKSIEEIHRRGFNIKPCPKGADSVEFGHQKVNQYRQYWTKDSTRCIKEQRNFRYIPDKDGRLTGKTTHIWSHGMDARRYGVMGRARGPAGKVEAGETKPAGAFGGIRRKDF